ncbi:MAG: amino acid ABC transporter ATP-binding protein [Desulfurococcales archaeon]|nr:amino acid ABC transporter ATP-binding protein [Desulfurococcales archaeon]
MKTLELIDIHAGYRGHEVLHGVSLTVDTPENVVIAGPSGSGKSTLLKVIPRLVEPTKGKIIFKGVDVTGISDEKELRSIRSKIGYLPQHYGLFPHMKVIDNVTFPLRVVKKVQADKARETALRYLKLFGIEDLADRYPSQLSGGQQQRTALARALAMDPDLLLLDEPTSALDPESRLDVLDALYEVARLGKSMIIVTHEMDFALEIADKMLYMENGVIIAEGEPHEIISSNERIRDFLHKLAGTVKGMDGSGQG